MDGNALGSVERQHGSSENYYFERVRAAPPPFQHHERNYFSNVIETLGRRGGNPCDIIVKNVMQTPVFRATLTRLN